MGEKQSGLFQLSLIARTGWWQAALFGLCVAPTFISYQSYVYTWDDSDYLQRSIAVSRSFWSGNAHGIVAGMAGIRPPVMDLLGVPWGPLGSWDAAGKCFVTLGALTSLLAALCLYLLLRIGVKPVLLVIASICVVASLGPDPLAAVPSSMDSVFSTHVATIGFLADGIFAWMALAAILLVPYEARTHSSSIKDSVIRGILWGAILSLGAITKVSSFYLIILILPTIFVLRLGHSGLRNAFAALIALAGCSVPAAIYWLRWGASAWNNARASSFGPLANAWYTPLLHFLSETIRESPGLVPSVVLLAAALVYVIIQRRALLLSTDFLAVLIMIGFGIVALASPNREIRFVLPTIVALPFIIAVLLSGKGHQVDGPSAFLLAAFVFCGLVVASLPMRYRPNNQSLTRTDAVLAQAAGCNSKRILLATESTTLNIDLMRLAVAVSAARPSFEVRTLDFSTAPIEEDFRAINKSDQVVFQDDDALDAPLRLNQRVLEYQRYIRQQGRYSPIRVADLSIYPIHCSSH
jgi:hypothetical protein